MIKFNYISSKRHENSYLNSINIIKKEILNNIEVYTDSKLFKKYQLTHNEDTEGYQRLIKITELNSNNETANPIEFSYAQTSEGANIVYKPTAFSTNFDPTKISLIGDFDGDNYTDFVLDNKILFNSLELNSDYQASINTNGKKLQGIVLFNNKMIQHKSLITIEENSNNISLKLNIFSRTNQLLNYNSYTKNIDYDNTSTCYDYCNDGFGNSNNCSLNPLKKTSNKYLEGDFNGDGLSEVLIFGFQDLYRFENSTDPNYYILRNLRPISPCNSSHEISDTAMKINLIDLRQNASTIEGTEGNITIQNPEIFGSGERYVIDYNSDGKADVICINENGFYRVIGFKQLSVFPWIENEILAQGFLESYSKKRQILFGDYNGDGKTDFMFPKFDCGNSLTEECRDWNIYYANPNTSFANSFIKQKQKIAYYQPLYNASNGSEGIQNYYYALDVNKDGKSDFVHVEIKKRDIGGFLSGPQIRNSWRVKSFINNIGNQNYDVSSSFLFVNDYDSGDQNARVYSLPLVINQKNNGLESDFMMLSYDDLNPNFSNNGRYANLRFINFNKNFQKNNLLTKVSQSNGAIVDEIEYSKMTGSNVRNGFGNGLDFYSSDNSYNYPLVEIKGIYTNDLVAKHKNTALGITKSKLFFYKGLVINYESIGIINFKKTAQTSWYLNNDSKKVWSITESNPLYRGAVIKNQTLFLSTPINLDSNYTGLISETNYQYDVSPNGVLPSYLLLKNEKSKDFLTNVVTEKVNQSFTTDYFLPKVNIINKYLGTQLQSSSTTTTNYEPAIINPSYYLIGRPNEINISNTTYVNTSGTSDTKFSNQKLYYSNHKLIKTEKKSNNSTETLVEEYDYFSNGLLKAKKNSAIGTTSLNAVASRTVSYTYDSTNRFIKTTTDPEGLVTTNNTYHNIYGLVTSQTNPFGQTTQTVFDFWGKQTKVTDFLGKSITYTYTKNGGRIKILQTGDDQSESFIEQDFLAREVRKGNKDFNGNWNYITTEYDNYGRKSRISEPYSHYESPTQWTTTEYDDYSRPIKVTTHNGKVVSTTYNGLTIVSTEPTMTKSKTLNANEQVIVATDTPGGNIYYKYDASGNMIESDYDGIKMTISYDNWGRKESLVDTSMGTYTYAYDAFGQLKTESSPKGTTTFVYNAFGKTLTKSIQGNTSADFTNITSTYSYDPVNKWLTNISVANPNDGNSNYAYSYDPVTKQLNKTIETLNAIGSSTIVATFTKQLVFDLFGRVSKEISTASAFSKSSTKTITHNYKNGVKWQMLDGTALIWQANLTNSRGQLTNLSLGNGINITNSYNNLGFQTQNKHDKGSVNVMTLNTTFEPILGNLTSRFNSMFNASESFNYDVLDRLFTWDGASQNILTLPFNSTTEGFVFVGNSTKGSVVNSAGTLKVMLKEPSQPDFPIAAQRNLPSSYSSGDKIRVRANITNKTGSTGVIVNAVIVETDPADPLNYIENTIGVIENGIFDVNYTVTNFIANPTLKIKFEVSENSPLLLLGGGVKPPNTIFYLDNLIIDKTQVFIQNYDDRGRITDNNLGKYRYDNSSNKPYQNNSILLSVEGKNYYSTTSTQNISYNAFKSPIQIEQLGVDNISYGYNGMEERSIMYWGNTNSDKLKRPFRRYYSADGSMEIKATFALNNPSTPTSVEILTYIGGDAYSAPAVIKSNGISQNYFYLHRDYQGSIMAITNAVGAVVEKRLYNPWGEIVKIQDGANNNLTKLTFFDRGYTGHEHLESVGLIHMNARLYDPKLHRFLQADNFIQDPNNTQNYNRYAYCVNNPLKYTDITGNVFGVDDAIIIGIGVSLFMHVATALINHQPIYLSSIMSTVIIAGFSSAVTFGIGEFASNAIGNVFLRAAFQSIAHGVVQGQMTYMQGGSFWSGFASGSISSMVSSGWQHTSGSFGKSGAGTIFFGTVSGGLGAKLTGGNFWQGAVSGFLVSTLNHYGHKNNFDEEINSYYGKNADKPVMGMSQSDIDKAIKNIPTLKNIHTKLLTKFKNLKVYYSDVFGKEDGKTYFDLETQKVSSISIFRSSGSSYRYMSQTILHEFGHAMSGFHGFYFDNAKKYGKYSSMPTWIDEIYAHKFANYHGGVNYNTPYYDSFVNALKNSSYQLDASKIKLPSYNY